MFLSIGGDAAAEGTELDGEMGCRWGDDTFLIFWTEPCIAGDKVVESENCWLVWTVWFSDDMRDSDSLVVPRPRGPLRSFSGTSLCWGDFCVDPGVWLILRSEFIHDPLLPLSGDSWVRGILSAGAPLSLPLTLVEGAPFSLCLRGRRVGVGSSLLGGTESSSSLSDD